MVKLQTTPTVYVVGSNGVLRALTSEEQAENLFGPQWAKRIDDLPDVFFSHYEVGEPLRDGEIPEGLIFQDASGSLYRMQEDIKLANIDNVVATGIGDTLKDVSILFSDFEKQNGKSLTPLISTTQNSFESLLPFFQVISIDEKSKSLVTFDELIEQTPVSSDDDEGDAVETWQIQGTGHSYQTATKIVQDGSTLSYAFSYGEEAGTDLVDQIRFYYNPVAVGDWGNGIRTATNDSKQTDYSSIDAFEPEDSGLKIVCDQKNLDDCSSQGAYLLKASQAVPLMSEETVRLFFEAQDLSISTTQPTTQIYSLDSQDGWMGEDDGCKDGIKNRMV